VEVVLNTGIVMRHADARCDFLGITFRANSTHNIEIEEGGLSFEDCNIDGHGYGGGSSAVAVRADGALLIKGGKVKGCVQLLQGDCVVEDCEITGTMGSGLFFKGVGERRQVVRNCRVQGAKLANIAVTEGADPMIYDCLVHSSKDVGVYIFVGGHGHFVRCTVTQNNLGGVQVQDGSDPVLEVPPQHLSWELTVAPPPHGRIAGSLGMKPSGRKSRATLPTWMASSRSASAGK
jgi:hypothetical protein